MPITIKPLSNHGIAADFLRTYWHALKHTTFLEWTSPSRVLFLRPSQMPFCAMGFFFTHSRYGMRKPKDFAMAFYTSVGTAVHEVMQNFLCRSGNFLADYECLECGKWHRMSYKHECCGFPTQYHEVEIDYKGIKGHIDAVYRDKNGKLWIVDFKTTSIKGAPYKKKDPGVTYKEQIEIYAVLIELQYGIRIEGFADSFIVRDNPMKNDPPMWNRPLTDDIRKKVKAKLARYKKMHKAALTATTKAEALALFDWGRCQDPYCPVCKEKSDTRVKELMVRAYKFGRGRDHLPLKAMAEHEEERIAELRSRRQSSKSRK